MNDIFLRYAHRLRQLILLAIVAGAVLSSSILRAQADPSPPAPLGEAANAIYLPMVSSASQGAPPAPTAKPLPTNPSANPTSIPLPNPTANPTASPTPNPAIDNFVEREKKTYSQSIVIDAQGGTHLAYRAAPSDSENYSLVYAYCSAPASRCNEPDRWQRIRMLAQVDQVQLALTHDGHPRILARSYAADYKTRIFTYGECNSNCFGADAWQLSEVAATYPDAAAEYYAYLLPTHYFALNAQDRPRFAFPNYYRVTMNGQEYPRGSYYAQCDADCTNAQNWVVQQFTHMVLSDLGYEYRDQITYPSLAFTSQGAPRIVANLVYSVVEGETTGLYYFGCDNGCESDTNWERVKIAERGNGPHPVWDLAFDSNDRAHVAFYEEPDVTSLTNNRLYYLTCASDCARGGAWNNLDLELPAGTGDGVDLALDSQGRPRMAYLDAENSLGYAWCNGSCENNASWQHNIIETRSQLEAEFSVPILPSCDGGFWDTLTAMMTLDGQDNSHVAYRGTFQERCYKNDPSNPSEPPKFTFEEIWHTVRLTNFPQP